MRARQRKFAVNYALRRAKRFSDRVCRTVDLHRLNIIGSGARPSDADLERYCYESEPIARRISIQSRAYWPPASILRIATLFASEH